MRCGLLGEHLAHSYSPEIHQMLGEYSYELFEIAPEDLDAFLRSDSFDALNVTIPYKRSVIPYCATLSDAAKAIGSINTLLRRPDGTLHGDNTDSFGFHWLLERSCDVSAVKKALILGSGGASLTVQQVLKDLGIEYTVFSRQGPNTYDTLPYHKDAQLVVNATPVGMYPNNGGRLIDLSLLPECRCVLDLIYNPARTQLLLDAEALGIPRENGLPMLVAQAKYAAELFTGKHIPNTKIDDILCKLKKDMTNIILIGMPGCGKSTVGRILAESLHRPFYDADEVLTEKLGCSIPECFAQKGESAFRKAETEVLRDLGKQSGCVISTGGGCVTCPENYAYLHQNGMIFWLNRELCKLPLEGRPISQSVSLEALYAQRAELYARFADIAIENHHTPEETATQIKQLFGLER